MAGLPAPKLNRNEQEPELNRIGLEKNTNPNEQKPIKSVFKTKAFIASFLSLLFMGLGQFYNRQIGKGLFFSVLWLYIIIFYAQPFQWAMWGLRTLGETPQIRERGRVVFEGHHSIFLMIEGIIALLIALVILCIYVISVRDAYKVGKERDKGVKPCTLKQSLQNSWEHGFAYILLTPTVIFTLFLTILPLVFSVMIAFTNYSGPNYLPPRNLVDWVGFQTFIDLFNRNSWSRTFYGVFMWTIVWAVLTTFTTFFVGFFYAVLIESKGVKFKKFWRGIFILPWAIPAFVMILIMRNIFNGQFGPINKYINNLVDQYPILAEWGLSAIPFFTDPTWAKIMLVVVNMWFGFPFWMILMAGVMTGIDKEQYEAAEIDGASAWQKFRNITFPIVMFSTSPLLIMSFAGNFNNFNMIYLFTEGRPTNPDYSYAGSTDILISWIYKMTFDHNQFAMASAVGLLIFIVVAIFSVWNFSKTRAFKEEDMMR
ncbi:carbohydrate ABC transporter permease [Halalkalibacter alkaliphilus]|uniref:Maltose/maltodextrin transport system permease protein n=1 Tax=Halalkalibacter alkaliphilus TaxID=2917993 RepID=A0A9X2CN21_9BACI|nr:sugar ABC transporter permease [Halalkalibacter alkaliphilus]MCL7746173.1 sugar ABC transporter permease [Halalkalibacter alkaliphilus]